MTKLEQLLAQHCPNGVEYIQLNTICEIYDGTHQTPQYTDSGVKFVSVENIGALYETTKYISEEAYSKYKIKPQLNDVLMTRIGSIGVCAVVDRTEDLAYYVSLALLRPNQNVLNSKYLKYVIESKHGRKELYKRTLLNAVPIKVNMGDIGKIIIPIPPLSVQEEIVRILDDLTEKTDKLISELNAELEERKKQYEYFQNELFANSEDMQYVDAPLGDVIISLKTGLNPRKNFKLNTPDSCCPYITGKDIFNNKVNVTSRTDEIAIDAVALINKRACIETDDLLFASTGTGTVGRMAIVEDYRGDWSISESIYAIKVNKNIVLPQFLMYLLYTENVISQYKPKITKASVPHLKVADLIKVKISIPSIKEQERIIKKAEEFNFTQNSLINKLMYEIEFRKNQHEYYRDNLLTFKEIEA